MRNKNPLPYGSAETNEPQESFGRKTVFAIAEILEEMSLSRLTRLLWAYGLESSDANQGDDSEARATAVAGFLLDNPGLCDERGDSVRSAIVRDCVAYAIDHLEGDNKDVDALFRATYPELTRTLAGDGYAVQLGELRRRGVGVRRIRDRDQSHRTEDQHDKVAVSTGIRVFISHSSKDRDFVRALMNLLRSALNLPAEQIRCTSVDGYRLPAGASASEHLRREVHDAQAFIGVISPHSLQSLYVVFELGARWGAGKHLIPLLAPGVVPSILAAPLNDLNALQSGDDAQLYQLVTDLGDVLGIIPSRPAAYLQEINAIHQLPIEVEEASEGIEDTDELSEAEVVKLSSEARQILIEALNDSDPTIQCIRTGAGINVHVNQVELTDGASSRARKRWATAVRELENLGLIEDMGNSREAFELTVEGWNVAESLRDDRS